MLWRGRGGEGGGKRRGCVEGEMVDKNWWRFPS